MKTVRITIGIILGAGILAGVLFFVLKPQAEEPIPTTPLRGEAPTLQKEEVVVPAGSARIFFTDLQSGPNSGGENDAGVFVTIFGKNFGSNQGSSAVMIGGGEVASYPVWSDSKIIVQIGPGTRTGDIVVVTSNGESNGVPFSVRPGGIYFVSASGNDEADGSFASPWRTIQKAVNSIAAGDTIYVRHGVSQTVQDNYYDAALSIETSGSPDAPKALVAYPGAQVVIGSTQIEFGTRVPNIDIAASDWVFSGLMLRGQRQALDIGGTGSSRWRVVGNDISCPVGDGQTGCFAASLASNITFIGNDVHDISAQGPQPSKQYHAVYFTSDTNHVEVAWNTIHDNMTCRAIQFHSSPLQEGTGLNQYDLSVHDNVIRGDVCDGIIFATVDPSKGRVEAYNNIIYDVGRGPDPPDDASNYTCIYVAGVTNTGPDGTGNVEVYNNTLYNCGSRKSTSSGAVSKSEYSRGLYLNLRNNIIYALPGEEYIANDADRSRIRGSNNLWFGAEAAPSETVNNISADPQFVNAAAGDFRLQPGSPAIGAGVGGEDLGAIEFSQ